MLKGAMKLVQIQTQFCLLASALHPDGDHLSKRPLEGREGHVRATLLRFPRDSRKTLSCLLWLIHYFLYLFNCQNPFSELNPCKYFFKGPFSVSRSRKQYAFKNQLGTRFCSLNKYFYFGPN